MHKRIPQMSVVGLYGAAAGLCTEVQQCMTLHILPGQLDNIPVSPPEAVTPVKLPISELTQAPRDESLPLRDRVVSARAIGGAGKPG